MTFRIDRISASEAKEIAGPNGLKLKRRLDKAFDKIETQIADILAAQAAADAANAAAASASTAATDAQAAADTANGAISDLQDGTLDLPAVTIGGVRFINNGSGGLSAE